MAERHGAHKEAIRILDPHPLKGPDGIGRAGVGPDDATDVEPLTRPEVVVERVAVGSER